MAYTSRISYVPMQSLDTSTLSGSYLPLGNPLPNACSIVKIVNNSNVTVTISIDGSTACDVVPAGGFFLYDVTTNRTSSSTGEFMPKGTQYYVKSSAGTGLVYLVGLYILEV